ncbi:unnamed protein product [Enterobius vermicularis]|uniref:DNTTIP1_dimer domain-containing protein n=1 Tax=Enterobius vermicularis TaxID=51028 RepID=A0A0N4UXG6_ENTVE|nr:unnamed protein product [Enterobius vermicularis]
MRRGFGTRFQTSFAGSSAFEGTNTSLGNGNKMNMRLRILTNCLDEAEKTADVSKVNMYKDSITRSRCGLPIDAARSLDLMRQIFQSELTRDLQQVLDRHIRVSFAPAFEHLKNNGHAVTDDLVKELYRNILEAAKAPYMPSDNSIPDFVLDLISTRDGAVSDIDSEASVVSTSQPPSSAQTQIRPRKRGRPRKVETDCGRSGTPLMRSTENISALEAYKWNPDRVSTSTRFILGSKVYRLLATPPRGNLYAKYPRLFRYVCDEDDRAWLMEKHLTTRQSGKIFLMMLEDVIEIAFKENCYGSPLEFEKSSFTVPESLIAKVKQRMAEIFEQLKPRISNSPQNLT